MQTARYLLALSLGLVIGATSAGCALDDGPVGPGGGDGPTRISSTEPGVDDRLDALGIICESTLTVNGTFVEGSPQPADEMGCWAVGTWRVQATVDFQGCDPQPEMLAEYVYEITRNEDAQTNVTYTADPDSDRQNLKITTDGGNLCNGSFEHYFEDGTVLVLQPTLQLDGSLSGAGAFSVYEEDPF